MMDNEQINWLDRVGQVNWLTELAGNLSSGDWPGTPEEIVEYYIEAVTNDPEEEMPEWFDGHDDALLIRLIKECQEVG